MLRILAAALLALTSVTADAAYQGVGPGDNTAFTLGTSPVLPLGCFYQAPGSITGLTAGDVGIWRCTIDRQLMQDLEKVGGQNIILPPGLPTAVVPHWLLGPPSATYLVAPGGQPLGTTLGSENVFVKGGRLDAVNSQTLVNTNNKQVQPHICGASVFKHITTATDTLLVALVPGQVVYVCDYEFSFNATGNANLESSTSATCASTFTQIAGAWYGVANSGKAGGNAFWRGMATAAGQSLCVNTTQAVSFDITVFYDQY